MSRWLAAHRRSVLFVLMMLALGGLQAAARLPVGLFPRIDFPRIVVGVDAGDRPVEGMIAEVTLPIEQALRGVPGVLGLRSTTSRGAAEMSVNLDWGTDMVAAQLQVESALNGVLTDLPAGTRFEVRRMDPTVFPVLGYALTSKTRDMASLREIAELQVLPMMSSVAGVAQARVIGGDRREYQVLADPMRLRAAGLTPSDLATRLEASNVYTAAGRIEDRYRLYLTLSSSRPQGVDDLARLPIAAGRDGVLRLGDVAEVREAVEQNWTRVVAGGRQAVLIDLRQARGANSVALVREVRARLARHAAELPADVEISSYYDQSELVVASVASVRDAILIGALLAAGVLLLFLRNLRLTLVVAAVLPAVLAMTALLLQVFGLSFNIMTLGGMAAAVGLIVDDTVVMVEHLVRRAEDGGAAADDALAAAAELLRPLAGSSAATIVIFAPLALLSGVTGGFFKALALTMACALGLSLVVAAAGVPLVVRPLLGRVAERRRQASPIERATTRYLAVAGRVLDRPWPALLLAVLLLAGGGVAGVTLPSGFIPKMDEGGFVLDYQAAPGTSLAETDRLLRQLGELIAATPEVDTYSRRTGLQFGGSLTEANEGDVFVRLKRGPRADIEDVMARLRTQAQAQIPGLQIETTQLMEDLIGDLTAVPQPVEVKLFGADRAGLESAARRVAAALAPIEGLVEVRDGLRVAGDALELRIDPIRAALEGLDAQAVSDQTATLIGGRPSGHILSGPRTIGVRLWTPAEQRSRLESIGSLMLTAPDGHALPLSRVAEVAIVGGQPQVVREDLEQMVAVTARLEGIDLGSAVRAVRSAVAGLQLPPSVRIEYGGLYAEQQHSFRDMATVFAAALMLLTALLLYLYERWSVVLAILATALLSVLAVFIGLAVSRTELDLSSMMGLTMVLGIVTEIAMFYFAELDPSAPPNRKALLRAGSRRLRPILMTALIAILALLPLALGLGAGTQMQRPLAIAISGLLAALPLVLLLMPVLYLGLSRLARRGLAGRESAAAGASP